MTKWIPIDMAPSDTYVLVIAYGEKPTVAKHNGKGHWSLAEVGGYAEDNDVSYNPTHWQHIEEFNL